MSGIDTCTCEFPGARKRASAEKRKWLRFSVAIKRGSPFMAGLPNSAPCPSAEVRIWGVHTPIGSKWLVLARLARYQRYQGYRGW